MHKNGVLWVLGSLGLSLVGVLALSCTDTTTDTPPAVVVDMRAPIMDLAPSATITVQDDYYSPQEVTIPVGGKVRWVFRALSQHGVFPWDMGFPGSDTMSMGTFENTFNQAGTFDYGCAIHGRAMPGRIIVK
jgi:plastocyanin